MTKPDVYALAGTLADRPDAAQVLRDLADRVESLLADGAAVRAEADALRFPAADPAAVTIAEFKRRAFMLWVRIASASADVQAKWDRIANSLLPSFTVLHLDDPAVVSMVGLAVQDGLLTHEDAAAVLAH